MIMLNKDLLEIDYQNFTREQLIEEIVSLKEQNECMKKKHKSMIENFRKYDENRKKYYAASMQELGELQSFVQEMDQDKLFTTMKNLKMQYGKLCNKLQYSKIPQEEKDDYDKVKSLVLQENMKKHISSLKEKLRKLQYEKQVLLMKLWKKEVENQ